VPVECLRDLSRSGTMLDVVGAVLIWIALRLLRPLFGVM
jgi:hypothetical protein